MGNIPSLSSAKFVKVLTEHGCEFIRNGKGDHAIYEKRTENQVRRTPVQMGKNELAAKYITLVMKQLGFAKSEIEDIFSK